MSLLRTYEQQFRPFTGEEGWFLFRLSAYAEALGWTLLISGIALKHYVFGGKDLPVLIAGQLHGTLFIIYMVACLITYPSQRWSRWRTVLAVAASVPPYGSLVFEQWVAWQRGMQQTAESLTLHIYRYISVK